MNISPINSNQQNFKALVVKKRNPYISKELRKLAKEATDLYESVVYKQPVIDGVKADMNFREGVVKLRKQVDGDNVELKIVKLKKRGGTRMSVSVNPAKSFIYKEATYDSKSIYTEAEELYQNIYTKSSEHVMSEFDGTNEEYLLLTNIKEAEKTFLKYASPILKAADKIKTIFCGEREEKDIILKY